MSAPDEHDDAADALLDADDDDRVAGPVAEDDSWATVLPPRVLLVERLTTTRLPPLLQPSLVPRAPHGFHDVRFGAAHVLAAAFAVLPRELVSMVMNLRSITYADGAGLPSPASDASLVAPLAPEIAAEGYVAHLGDGNCFALIFAPCRVLRYLKLSGYTCDGARKHERLACRQYAPPTSAAAVLALVLQVVVGQVFVRALAFMLQRRIDRITPHIMLMVVQRDAALRRLFGTIDTEITLWHDKFNEAPAHRRAVASWVELCALVPAVRSAPSVASTVVRVPLFGARALGAFLETRSAAGTDSRSTHLLAAQTGDDPGELPAEYDLASRVRLDPYRYTGRVLPFSVVSLVMAHVHQMDLLAMMLVSKQWYELARDPQLWRSIRCAGVEHCVSDALLAVLLRRAAPHLQHLSLAHCYRLTHVSLRRVVQCAQLESLDLSGVMPSNPLAQRPHRMQHNAYAVNSGASFQLALQALDPIADAPGDNEFVRVLELVPTALTRLTALSLNDCNVNAPAWLCGGVPPGDAVAAEMYDVMADACTRLTQLSFAGSLFERQGTVATILRRCRNLRRVELVNMMGTIGMVRSLGALAQLSALDVAVCTVPAAHIAQSMFVHPELRELALVRSRATALTMTSLAASAPLLTRVDVSFSNEITGDGVAALVEASSCLTHLTVRSCRGMRQLEFSSASLQHFDASENANLVRVELSAPELRWLSLRNAFNVTQLHLYADKLRTLLLSYTALFTDRPSRPGAAGADDDAAADDGAPSPPPHQKLELPRDVLLLCSNVTELELHGGVAADKVSQLIEALPLLEFIDVSADASLKPRLTIDVLGSLVLGFDRLRTIVVLSCPLITIADFRDLVSRLAPVNGVGQARQFHVSCSAARAMPQNHALYGDRECI